MGPRESHHRASSSSRPAKNAGSVSPVSREEPMSWATSDPYHRHSAPTRAETTSVMKAKARRARGSVPGVVAAMASRRAAMTWAAVRRPSIMRWGRVMRRSA